MEQRRQVRQAPARQNGQNKKSGGYRPSRTVKLLRLAVGLLCILLVISGILLFTWKPSEEEVLSYTDNGTFYEGITINGKDVSGMTFEEARNSLLPTVQQDMQKLNITVTSQGTSWVFSANDLGVTSTLDQALCEGIALGRGDTAVNNLAKQKELKENGYNIDIKLAADSEVLAEKLAAIGNVINTEPEEPHVTPDKDAAEPAFTYFEGKNGYLLDEEALALKIAEAIDKGDYTASFDPVLVETAPEHDVEWLKANIKQRSVFTTSFESSHSAGRVRNIVKATDILNGMVIQPGQEISFNEFVGGRYEKDGWALAPGIVNGNQYEMQAGGGICQVSTTLYNALLCAKGGYNETDDVQITVRKKHSWPSSYVDYGLDATVSTGGPDLAFKNNTDAPLYVFVYADTVNYISTVYVYGTPLPDGVTYITRGIVEEELEAPETKIVEEPTWPTGYSSTTIKSRTGYVATAYLVEIINGVEQEPVKLYTDKYSPVQGEKHVGVGAASLPKPEE